MQMEARVLRLKSHNRAVPSSDPLSRQHGGKESVVFAALPLLLRRRSREEGNAEEECARHRTGAVCPLSLISWTCSFCCFVSDCAFVFFCVCGDGVDMVMMLQYIDGNNHLLLSYFRCSLFLFVVVDG